METDNLLIKDSLKYIGGKLIDILDFELDNLKIDKKVERSYYLLS